MGASTPHANLTSEDSGFMPFSCGPSCKESCVEYEQCMSIRKEETVEVVPQQDLDISSVSENSDLMMVQELGIALGVILYVQEGHEQVCGSNPTSDLDEICNRREMQPLFLGDIMHEGLSKYATFPCVEQQSCSLSFRKERLLGTTLDSQSSSKAESSASAHSRSIPTTTKLVSAMKGGREQQGAPLTAKLCVKWAPDVYDPPATSTSHTVKSHHHRPRAKKKDYKKHKHNKGKSSRGSSDKRKHANWRSTSNIIDPLDLRWHAPGDKLPLDGFGQSALEVLDYAVRGQESKCGSSFLGESLARVPFSIAEAS